MQPRISIDNRTTVLSTKKSIKHCIMQQKIETVGTF
jgi:hypothetical protein